MSLTSTNQPVAILHKSVKKLWKEKGCTTDPPTMPMSEFLDAAAASDDFRKAIADILERLQNANREDIQKETQSAFDKLERSLSTTFGMTLPEFFDILQREGKMLDLDLPTTYTRAALDLSFGFARLTTGRDPKGIVDIRDGCLTAHKIDPNIKIPWRCIIEKWIDEQNAKPISADYDSTHPIAIIQREHMGSIRDVIATSDEIQEITAVSAPAPNTSQIFIPGLETPSCLPAVLPLQAIHINDTIMATTKRGAVAMPIRLFFEAIMALDPKKKQDTIRYQLGDLLQFLNPDGKYHRTNHLPYVLQGLHNLLWLRIPYRSEPDKPSTETDWIPVLPRNVPTINSGDDATIIFEVKLPPDLPPGGMIVKKQILRQLGKHSSARFNAYLTVCWLFDKYGTVRGKLINPTKPIENRDPNGRLLNTKGERIVNSRGTPVTNLYSPDAIKNLPRAPNPARDQYKIVPFDDLIRACFPQGYPPGRRAMYLTRAKKAWKQLDTEGIIQIEECSGGWRIMPSESHVNLYQALKKHKRKA